MLVVNKKGVMEVKSKCKHCELKTSEMYRVSLTLVFKEPKTVLPLS